MARPSGGLEDGRRVVVRGCRGPVGDDGSELVSEACLDVELAVVLGVRCDRGSARGAAALPLGGVACPNGDLPPPVFLADALAESERLGDRSVPARVAQGMLDVAGRDRLPLGLVGVE